MQQGSAAPRNFKESLHPSLSTGLNWPLLIPTSLGLPWKGNSWNNFHVLNPSEMVGINKAPPQHPLARQRLEAIHA